MMCKLQRLFVVWLFTLNTENSYFPPATIEEISRITHYCPNKQCGLDALSISLLKHCSSRASDCSHTAGHVCRVEVLK